MKKNKEIISLTYEGNNSYENQNVCYKCKQKFSTQKNDKNTFKLYCKVRYHCYYNGKYGGTAHDIWNLRYKTPKANPAVFHNGFTYDYHFIIKELPKKFEGQFESLQENTGKYNTFSVTIKKELDNGKIITHKLKFFDSFRFMQSSSSKLANNLSEIQCKSVCNFIGLKNNKLHYKCNDCRKRQ